MSKTCPHCGYVVPDDTRPMLSEDSVLKCPNCGKDLEKPPGSEVEQTNGGTKGSGSDAVDRGPVPPPAPSTGGMQRGGTQGTGGNTDKEDTTE